MMEASVVFRHYSLSRDYQTAYVLSTVAKTVLPRPKHAEMMDEWMFHFIYPQLAKLHNRHGGKITADIVIIDSYDNSRHVFTVSLHSEHYRSAFNICSGGWANSHEGNLITVLHDVAYLNILPKRSIVSRIKRKLHHIFSY